MRAIVLGGLSLLMLVSCDGTADAVDAAAPAPGASASPGSSFTIRDLGKFNEPWAMTFLPDGLLLITEKSGRIRFLDLRPSTPRLGAISGGPRVDYGGQGGLGDVVAHPDFARNRLIYFSYVEAGPDDTRGAAVARGRLVLDEADAGRIEGLQVIWRQYPKVEGRGHFGHRLAFGPDGKLYISNGERQKFDPAQDMAVTLGKIVRINDDGTLPPDNPWASRGGVTAQLWTAGHRNVLGLAFDREGRLWSHEMGPKGGDEFNLIEKGANYGYPIVSNGDHYDGKPIPDHPTRPEFNAPRITWNGLSPAGLMIYSGRLFPRWRGNAFLGGLSGKALVRVTIDGRNAREAQRWDMGRRIREVEEGPDGAIYILEDEQGGSGGRLLKLIPIGGQPPSSTTRRAAG